MSIVREYYFYKRFILTIAVINVFFVIVGCLALAKYFQVHDVSTLELILTGSGTVIFGLILPWFAVKHFLQNIKEMRLQTEKRVAQWVSEWIENYRLSEDEALKDPTFWINIAFMTIELLSENSRHPAARAFNEFAPIIRKEIQKSIKSKTPGSPARKSKNL